MGNVFGNILRPAFGGDCDVLVPDIDLLPTTTAMGIEPLGEHYHRALRLIGKGKVFAPRVEIYPS